MTDEKEYVDVSRLDAVAYTRPDGSTDYQNGFEDGVSFILDKVDNLPREKAVPVVHAHWDCYHCSRFLGWKDGEPEPRWADGKYYYCSLCRRRTVIRENYCPKCGAKMDEEE